MCQNYTARIWKGKGAKQVDPGHGSVGDLITTNRLRGDMRSNSLWNLPLPENHISILGGYDDPVDPYPGLYLSLSSHRSRSTCVSIERINVKEMMRDCVFKLTPDLAFATLKSNILLSTRVIACPSPAKGGPSILQVNRRDKNCAVGLSQPKVGESLDSDGNQHMIKIRGK